MRVVTIPCLKDNYAYLIICEETGLAGIVDPSEFEPVWSVIQSEEVELVAILNTHHHWDHTGGNKRLLQVKPGLQVYGHHSDKGRIDGQNVFLSEQDTIQIGNLIGTFTHNPAHTTGAVSYYFENAVFTGDTLFAAGCGRLFEGSAEDMYIALNKTIGSHSPETKVYFGHEYTQKNLKFALLVEPDNLSIKARLEKTELLLKAGQFTTPSTLKEEMLTNPFMRCSSASIQATASKHDPSSTFDPVSVLRVIRHLKDNF